MELQGGCDSEVKAQGFIPSRGGTCPEVQDRGKEVRRDSGGFLGP